MASIFISHEKSDRDFVANLSSLFETLGFESWAFEKDIHAAEYWQDSIQKSLEKSDWFVLVMSSSAAQSEWVKREVSWALEHKKGRVIPLKRDDSDGRDIHHQLPDILYLNFARDETAATVGLIQLLVGAGRSAGTTVSYVESLTVEVGDTAAFLRSGGGATVRASSGCEKILDWKRDRFTWNDFKERMSHESCKGTFWITEMQDVMADVIRESSPRVMTSTFRGRGKDEDVDGQIFRPRLRESQTGSNGTVFRFDIDRVLVPELVCDEKPLGDLYFLLHIVARVRWEVLEPFLKKAERQSDDAARSQEYRTRLINTVSGSLRLIESELDRHSKWNESFVKSEFQGEDQAALLRMLRERGALRQKITAAIERQDYADLMVELRETRKLNIKSTALLTGKLAELAEDERKRLDAMEQRVDDL